MNRNGIFLKISGIIEIVSAVLMLIFGLVIVIIGSAAGTESLIITVPVAIILIFVSIPVIAVGGFQIWLSKAVIEDARRLDALQKKLIDLTARIEKLTKKQ